jgi:glucose-6-phosphate 1-dehydrogenase
MASYHGSEHPFFEEEAKDDASRATRGGSSVNAPVLRPGGIEPVPAIDPQEPADMVWLTSATLAVVVVGASGDLAKKKTYPSLLDLYDDNLLPKNTTIYGYARSNMTSQDLRDRLRPYLLKMKHSPEVVERFLNRCMYQGGSSYGDLEAYTTLAGSISAYERGHPDVLQKNRLFYFAIPPNVFAETALAIKKTCMQDESLGFTRLIVEKPFGRDLESFEELNKTLSAHFTEDHLFRIDHYLGKELVQNLTVLRFSNRWLEQVWNKENVQCVILTFKEDITTQGRGGYFDKFGIVRDILQNHLLQVLTLMAMEPPAKLQGPDAGQAIRDAKVAVLNAIPPIEIDEVVLGQYEGYADDPTIENKDTNTPTFATIRLFVNTPRWKGVPFIMKAGKALNERKAEMRIQFKDPPAASAMFNCGYPCPRNELGTFAISAFVRIRIGMSLHNMEHSLIVSSVLRSPENAAPRSHLHKDEREESRLCDQAYSVRARSQLRYPLLRPSNGIQPGCLHAPHFGCPPRQPRTFRA